MQRCDVWEPDEDDGRVWEAVSKAYVSGHRYFRGVLFPR
jgi:hypothetical protein